MKTRKQLEAEGALPAIFSGGVRNMGGENTDTGSSESCIELKKQQLRDEIDRLTLELAALEGNEPDASNKVQTPEPTATGKRYRIDVV